MRRLLHQRRLCGRLGVNGLQCGDKGVQRLFGFRFGRLNHQRLVDDEREVHRRRVESVIQQALGHFQPAHPALPLPVGGEHHLVHTGTVIGQGVAVFQGVHQIVGIQHGVAADGMQPGCAQRPNVGIGAHQHAKVAVKAADFANAFRRFAQRVLPAVRNGNHRRGQIGSQDCAAAHRPGPRPAAAVGRTEGLVQVQMANVKPQVAQPGPPQQGVHIGPVAVHQPAAVVDNPAHFQYVPVEQPQGAGQRNHHAGEVVVGQFPQGGQVGVAVSVGRDGHHIKAGHGGRCRIRAVGAVGNAHFGAAAVALRQVVGPHHQHAGQFPVGAGQRGQAGGRHPRYFGEIALQPVQQLQRALRLGGRLLRVNPRKAGQERHLVIDLGVVLHRA